MERKEKTIDLLEVFNEVDRRLFLFKFDALVRHLSLERAESCCRLSGGQCHDINQVVTIITERLIQLVATKNEHKFEALLYSIPWAKYLFETTAATADGTRLGTVNRLQADLFVRLWSEYVQIFPHKSDKFIDSFMFLLRGDKTAGDDITLSVEEKALFSALTPAIGQLFKKVHTFEASLVGALKKRYPFYHNATVHEFTTYIGNLITISDQLPEESENYLELYHFLYGHLLAVDNRQFFEDISERHIRDGDSQIIFEFEDINTTTVAEVQAAAANAASNSSSSSSSITVDERLKKFKVLDGACRLLFEYIDRHLLSTSLSPSISSPCTTPNLGSTRDVTTLISLFFSRLLTGSSIHVQYFAFYLCGRSTECCDAFVNDLWTISVSGSEALAVREGAFSYLVSLLRHAQYVHLNTVFSFLKILIQAMNAHLDAKLQASAAMELTNNIDHDVMYYNFAIGFARLFTAFHADLATIQVDCLKSMDLKRALMNDTLAPVQYFPAELRQAFHTVANYYRIGYFNVRLGELAGGQKQLSTLSAAHREHPPKFGRIRLPSVRAAVSAFLSNSDTLFESSFVADAGKTSFSSSLMNSPTDRGRGYACGGWSERMRSPAFGNHYFLATSPTTATNTSGDDFNGFLNSPNSFTPSSSNLMASMLSDMD